MFLLSLEGKYDVENNVQNIIKWILRYCNSWVVSRKIGRGILWISVFEKMKYVEISSDFMRSVASQTCYGTKRYMKDNYIVAQYGATADVLVKLWKLLLPHLPSNSEPHHLLWWLYNCKHYPTKDALHKALGVSPPTARRWMGPIKVAFVKIRNKVVSGYYETKDCFFEFDSLANLLSTPIPSLLIIVSDQI